MMKKYKASVPGYKQFYSENAVPKDRDVKTFYFHKV